MNINKDEAKTLLVALDMLIDVQCDTVNHTELVLKLQEVLK